MNSSRPEKERKKTHSLSFFLPGSRHNGCSPLGAADLAGRYRGSSARGWVEPGEVCLLFGAGEETELCVF